MDALEDRTLLSTFRVNSLGDSSTGSGNSGDLRYVISQVDSTSGDSTINFWHHHWRFIPDRRIDIGGTGVAYFKIFVVTDYAPTPHEIGTAIPAGTPDISGAYHVTLAYQGRTNGAQHQYRFYNTGIDGAGNTEAAHAAPSDVIFTQTFAQPAALHVTDITVERGAAERSYIRYVGVNFNESDSQSGGQLTQIASKRVP